MARVSGSDFVELNPYTGSSRIVFQVMIVHKILFLFIADHIPSAGNASCLFGRNEKLQRSGKNK